MDKVQWLTERKKCVTGTDIASIVGVSPWRTAFSVWQEKVADDIIEIPDNPAMSWGRRLEHPIAQAYSDQTGTALKKGEFTYKEIDGTPCGGTPDYVASDRPLLIEIKTSRSPSGWGDAGTDEIPEYYLTQVTWYMGLLGLPTAHIPVLFGGQDFRIYQAEFSRELFDTLLQAARDFWMHVTTNAPPDVDGSAACRAYIARTTKGGAGIMREPTEAIKTALDKLRWTQATIKEAEKAEAELHNILLTLLGEHDKAIADFGTVSIVRPKESIKTDWEAIARAAIEDAKLAELIAANTKTSPRLPYLKTTWNKE